MTVRTKLSQDIWSQFRDVIVRGHVFYEEEYLDADSIATLVEGANDVEEVASILDSFNGFYTVVIDGEKEAVIAADRMRTGPVFYSNFGDDFLISDNCGWILDQVRDPQKSEICEKEYMRSRFVTTSDTLFEEINQLQAGEIVVFDKNSGEFERTQSHIHTIPENYYEEPNLTERFEETLKRVTDRLIRVAQGRQIVIPLSGGYDSRLIALLLKRSGYDNILAYSDQSAGSKNAQVAEQVADNLGIPWTTVEVSHSDWHSFYNSQKWNEYFDRAAYLGGLPTPEHIIILETLLQEGEISPDAIVVPGDSSLDTMKATPPELEEKDRIDIDDLTEEIISQHFKYNTHIDLPREEMAERISETIGAGSEDTPKSAVEAFERWRLKERRTKLIINGSRAFDFVGLDWWIPLEERELYQFWRKVPPEKKRHRSFYEEYIEELYKRVGDVDREEATEIADTTLKSMVADRIRDYPIWDFTKAMYETWVDSSINKAYVENFKLREIYEDEPRYGVMSEDRLKSLYEGQNHIFYSILAQATVGRISLNSNDD